MHAIVLVFLGGGLGAAFRHAASLALARAGLAAPWPILAVNLAGCFGIGLLAALFLNHSASPWRLLLITGFLGGFTTYSSYILDLLNLADARHFAAAALYLSVHLIGGLILAAAGVFIGRAML